jgi:hypothetical protein
MECHVMPLGDAPFRGWRVPQRSPMSLERPRQFCRCLCLTFGISGAARPGPKRLLPSTPRDGLLAHGVHVRQAACVTDMSISVVHANSQDTAL